MRAFTERAPSLRRIVARSTSLVAAVAILVAGTLISLTTVLHRTTSSAASSVESVRLAEEAEIDLLLHERATDPLVRRNLEADLRSRLKEALRFVTTAHEHRILDAAVSKVDEYFAGAHDYQRPLAATKEAQQGAYGALEELVTVNLAQARNAHERAAWWDQVANGVGIGAAVLLIGFAGGVVVWLKRYAFAPVLALAEAIEGFKKGESTTRAKEDGAAEFRVIARQFNDMASTLERQKEQQLIFLAGVAHDIRNPLSALKMATAIISPDRPLPPEECVRQSFARIQRQIDHLERMVFDFLDAARIEAGNLELQMEECDLREVVRATVDLFEPAAPAHQFVVRPPDDPVRLTCDPARLEQVLNNLVSNAVKYSPRGGTIRVTVKRERDFVRISVADEGLGISPDDVDHVFEPFRRSSSPKVAIPGVGLGLFVARRIVEAHGGSITLESSPGNGSIFTVQLPRKADAQTGVVARPLNVPNRPPLLHS